MAEDSTSWLERLAKGDVQAAEELWFQFLQRLKAYADVQLRRLPPNTGDGEDIAMSVFGSLCRMAATSRFPRVSDPEQLWPYLAVIASRKVARLAQRSRAGRSGQQFREADLAHLEIGGDEVTMLSAVIGPEPTTELTEALIELWNTFLNELNSKEATLGRLWLEGHSHESISDATGFSPRTIARKLHKLRRTLRELASAEFDAKEN